MGGGNLAFLKLKQEAGGSPPHATEKALIPPTKDTLKPLENSDKFVAHRQLQPFQYFGRIIPSPPHPPNLGGSLKNSATHLSPSAC